MKIEQGTSFGSVREQDVDFSVAQLVETSGSFRRWFVSQADSDVTIAEYIGGVVHASYAGEGESDLEFGFRTATGDRHIVLVENKIAAVKQPNQIERYYNRGEFRVAQDNWDSYTVCLLAPERYVSPEDETGFDSIISYEDALEQIQNSSHDGRDFLQSVIEAALAKSRTSNTADATDTLRQIEDQFQSQTDIHHIELDSEYSGYNKRTSFKSTHPEHHDAIRYDVFVGETGDTGHTTIRLQIKSIDKVTETDRESLKSIASEHKAELQDYTWRFDRKVNIGSKQVGHEVIIQDNRFETYAEAIVDELLTLTDTFHPIFVRENS
jgi:hypothetical protein